jgi:hypothetical protein
MPDTRRPYPSGLSEEEWEVFEPLLVVPREPVRSSKWLPEGRTTHTTAGEAEDHHRQTRSI